MKLAKSNNRWNPIAFENWRNDLKHFDRIIAIAKHSYQDLMDIYQVTEEKLTCIPHGLKDKYLGLSPVERNRLRQKFGFTGTDKILIFVGRLDAVKGAFLLIKAFRVLKRQYPELRLIIAGGWKLQRSVGRLPAGMGLGYIYRICG